MGLIVPGTGLKGQMSAGRELPGSQGKAILPWSPEPAKVKASQGDLEPLLERSWKWEANFSNEIIITEELGF